MTRASTGGWTAFSGSLAPVNTCTKKGSVLSLVMHRRSDPNVKAGKVQKQNNWALDVRPDHVVQFGEPSSGRLVAERAVRSPEVVVVEPARKRRGAL